MGDTNILPAILFSTFALLLLFLATIIVIIAAHKERIRQKTRLAEAQIHYQQELRSVAAEVQEQTLLRLSEELHSNLGQQLTLIHMQLQQYSMHAQTEDPLLEEADANVKETIRQVRDMSHTLNATMVTGAGLLHMIRQTVSRLRHNGSIHIDYKEQGAQPALNADQQLVAFRIFQEAIANALKHSSAATLAITLTTTPFFCLEIADNGIGFDRAAMDTTKGAGLNLVQHRAELVQLHCQISSKPGQGTLWRITEPGT